MSVLLQQLKKANVSGNGRSDLTTCGVQVMFDVGQSQELLWGLQDTYSIKLWATVPSKATDDEGIRESNKAIMGMLLPNAKANIYELECALSDIARECGPGHNCGRIQDMVDKIRREIT
jgi:D-serine deaminase-like pyridoxal phosphate-dependent protein